MKWSLISGALGLVLLVIAHSLGLFSAPSEAYMGETGRILYVHVPTAWMGLLAYTIAFVGGIGSLWSGKAGWDALLEAFVEVGVVFTVLLLVQGSLWAKPTWDVYWTWDPKLTTSAILLVAFAGVLVLRQLIHNPERRATLSAVATIIAFIDVPLVYFSAEWWNSTHQDFSDRSSVSETMLAPLLIGIAGATILGLSMGWARWHIARRSRLKEEDAPDLPDTPEPLQLEESP